MNGTGLLPSVGREKRSEIDHARGLNSRAGEKDKPSHCAGPCSTSVSANGHAPEQMANCGRRLAGARRRRIRSVASASFVLKQVGPGVFAVIDGPEHKAGSNAGFVIGDDGVLVVDAFFNLETARALVGEIHRLTPKPIRYVVNTHYHVDHTGGDLALREAGAIIIAHRNVRAWVRVNNINLLGDRITPELKGRIDALPLPDVTTDEDLAVWLGSRKVVVRAVLGHTGGDLIVAVPMRRYCSPVTCSGARWRRT